MASMPPRGGAARAAAARRAQAARALAASADRSTAHRSAAMRAKEQAEAADLAAGTARVATAMRRQRRIDELLDIPGEAKRKLASGHLLTAAEKDALRELEQLERANRPRSPRRSDSEPEGEEATSPRASPRASPRISAAARRRAAAPPTAEELESIRVVAALRSRGVAALQRKLESAHLLTADEMGMVRAVGVAREVVELRAGVDAELSDDELRALHALTPPHAAARA